MYFNLISVCFLATGSMAGSHRWTSKSSYTNCTSNSNSLYPGTSIGDKSSSYLCSLVSTSSSSSSSSSCSDLSSSKIFTSFGSTSDDNWYYSSYSSSLINSTIISSATVKSSITLTSSASSLSSTGLDEISSSIKTSTSASIKSSANFGVSTLVSSENSTRVIVSEISPIFTSTTTGVPPDASLVSKSNTLFTIDSVSETKFSDISIETTQLALDPDSDTTVTVKSTIFDLSSVTFRSSVTRSVGFSSFVNSSVIEPSNTFTSSTPAFFLPANTSSSRTSNAVIPSLYGVLNTDGSASFNMIIPASLGPWNYVSIAANATSPLLQLANFSALLDGQPFTPAVYFQNNNGFDVTFTEVPTQSVDFSFDQVPIRDFTGDIIVTAAITIDRAEQLVKRVDEGLYYALTATASAIPGISSIIKSTATATEMSTTVYTVISCSKDSCTEHKFTSYYTSALTTAESPDSITGKSYGSKSIGSTPVSLIIKPTANTIPPNAAITEESTGVFSNKFEGGANMAVSGFFGLVITALFLFQV